MIKLFEEIYNKSILKASLGGCGIPLIMIEKI